MKEFIDKFTQKFQDILPKLILSLFGILIFSLVCKDFNAIDDGFIRPWIASLVDLLKAFQADASEIADTPLAQLTISKIFAFAFYMFVCWVILQIACGIWSCISEWLEERREKEFEEQLRRDREDRVYSCESRKECADIVCRMRKVESLAELNQLMFEAIGKWPEWEKNLSSVYKPRKKWIEKNG